MKQVTDKQLHDFTGLVAECAQIYSWLALSELSEFLIIGSGSEAVEHVYTDYASFVLKHRDHSYATLVDLTTGKVLKEFKNVEDVWTCEF